MVSIVVLVKLVLAHSEKFQFDDISYDLTESSGREQNDYNFIEQNSCS